MRANGHDSIFARTGREFDAARGSQLRMNDLETSVRRALHEARLDLTLEFRHGPDGTRSGSLLLRDASGTLVATVPLESPEAMNVALARLVQLGFGSAPPAPAMTPPAPARGAQVETSVLVAGVDGYRHGWVAVSLDPSGDVEVSTHSNFCEVLSLQARAIAVDIPIDPPGLGSRAADAGARAFVGGRASAVFATPPRAALEARTFPEANEITRTITGKGLSQQAYALGRKILEVHELAEADERVIEMHPEVSFRELAGGALSSKHTAEGLARRRELLAEVGIVLPGAVPGVPEADLLDAAAGAWTAGRYAAGTAEPFPPGHVDRLGAIWR
jgi:predicted RNase H-like nuclease